MALKTYDGFDHYASTVDMAGRSGFLQYTNIGGANFVTGPFGLGLALQSPGTTTHTVFSAVFADRNAEALVGSRWLFNISCGATYEFIDSLTSVVNVSIKFDPNNFSIQVYRGTVAAGTLLYVTPNNVWAGDTWNFIEMKVKVDSTTGLAVVKVNNNQILSQTGLDTQAAGGGAYWDTLTCITNGVTGLIGSTVTVDDLYYCDTTAGPGPLPYDDFLGDARCVTAFAIGNASVQFTPFLTSELVGSTATGATTGAGANTQVFSEFTPKHSGVLGIAVAANITGLTGHVVLGIYASDGPNGVPGTLITQSAPLTNPPSGANTFTMGSATTLESGVTYYWSALQDAATAVRVSGGGTQWYTTPEAYSGTMPASVSSATFTPVSAGVAAISATMTVTNAGNVSEVQMDGDTSYNFANTVTFEDLLNFQALPTEITLILALQLTGAYRKDDAGTRAVKQALKSGVTEVYGSDHYLSTGTYIYFTDLFVLDPHTSTNWLPTAINAVAAGYNVSV